jgi:hypothetical protein
VGLVLFKREFSGNCFDAHEIMRWVHGVAAPFPEFLALFGE